MLIASRRIDKDSELMKYVETIRERERASVLPQLNLEF